MRRLLLLPDPVPSGDNFILDDVFTTHDLLGIEVELEDTGVLSSKNYRYWHVTGDGSLRRQGAEFIFKVPLAGEAITSALSELHEAISNYGGSGTSRTSVHVHMDVRDITPEHLYGLLCLYVLYERVLYSLGGPKRYYNNNCIPVASNEHFLETMFCISNYTKYKEPKATFERIVNRCGKYSGLNLLSLTVHQNTPEGFADRGSIEFRMHEGTSQVSRITKWCQVLLRLKIMSKDLDTQNIIQDLQSKDLLDFTRTIFGLYADSVINTENFYDNMKLGFNDLKYAIKKHNMQSLRKKLKGAMKKSKVKKSVKKDINTPVDTAPRPSAMTRELWNMYPAEAPTIESDAFTRYVRSRIRSNRPTLSVRTTSSSEDYAPVPTTPPPEPAYVLESIEDSDGVLRRYLYDRDTEIFKWRVVYNGVALNFHRDVPYSIYRAWTPSMTNSYIHSQTIGVLNTYQQHQQNPQDEVGG